MRNQPAWPPVIDALAAAAGGDRARVVAEMVDWLATSPSPWSGFPAYESVPLIAIDLLGAAALAEAIGDRTDRTWLRAAARAAQQLEGSRTKIRAALAPVADRLLGAVTERGERLAVERVVLPPTRARVAGATVVAATRHADACLLAVDDAGRIYAQDGTEIVTFDDGAPRTLATLVDRFASCHADTRGVLFADMTAKRVAIAEAGVVRTIAEGQDRPMYPRLVGGEAYWVAAPFVPDPANPMFSIQESRLRRAPRGGGAVEELLVSRDAWDFTPTAHGIFYVARDGDRFAIRRHGGDDLAVLGGGDALQTRLLACDTGLAWRQGHRITAADPDGKNRRKLHTVDGDVRAWSAAPRGLAVVVEIGEGHEIIEVGWNGKLCTRARFAERSWLEVAIAATGVYFTAGHDILCST